MDKGVPSACRRMSGSDQGISRLVIGAHMSGPCSAPHGQACSYRYERADGSTVHGDASGGWMLAENGDVDDIVFFVSPRWVGDLERRGRLTHKPSDGEGAPAD
jgi:hypothetical protein